MQEMQEISDRWATTVGEDGHVVSEEQVGNRLASSFSPKGLTLVGSNHRFKSPAKDLHDQDEEAKERGSPWRRPLSDLKKH
ncbi:hypothetical protein PJP10_32025, partial [Mycobacterium kansasii]